MGLFGKLFEKKYCDICGEEIKLLGNKKLSDANMCKNCASKLSPWFTGRRKSSLEDIKEQLAYREENKNAVEAFNVTKTLNTATTYKILIDERAKKMIVTNMNSFKEYNPDVIDLEQLTGCTVDVTESRSELHRKDKDGKSVSYDPPRYKYNYDFYMILNINHPYFDVIRFKINSSTVVINPYEGNQGRVATRGTSMMDMLTGNKHQGIYSPEYDRYQKMGDDLCAELMRSKRPGGSSMPGAKNDAQESVKVTVPDDIACPWCGTVVSASLRNCNCCGGPLK